VGEGGGTSAKEGGGGGFAEDDSRAGTLGKKNPSKIEVSDKSEGNRTSRNHGKKQEKGKIFGWGEWCVLQDRAWNMSSVTQPKTHVDILPDD